MLVPVGESQELKAGYLRETQGRSHPAYHDADGVWMRTPVTLPPRTGASASERST